MTMSNNAPSCRKQLENIWVILLVKKFANPYQIFIPDYQASKPVDTSGNNQAMSIISFYYNTLGIACMK